MKRSHLALFLASSLSISLVACGGKSAQEHYEAATQAIEKKQYGSAIIELKNAIKLEPGNSEYRFQLGHMYLLQKQLPSAEKELEKALDLGYAPSEIVPLLSQTYRKTGSDNALVRLEVKKEGLTDREFAQVQFYQLQSYVRLNNIEKAKQLVAEIKTGAASNEYKQLTLVYELLINKQEDAAELQLKSILQNYPGQPDALKLKANLAISRGNFPYAIQLLQRYLTQNSSDLETKFRLAKLYAESGQIENADPILNELLKANPNHPILNQYKATIRLKQNEYQQAFDFAEKALASDPEDHPSRLVAGISSYFLNDYKMVNHHLSLVATLLPADHEALRILADSQLKLGLTLEARQTVDQFETIENADTSLVAVLGRALISQGQVSEARELLAKQPKDIEQPKAMVDNALFKLSLQQLDGLVDLEAALEKLNLSEESKQQSSNVEQLLVQAYLSTSQWDKALKITKNWQQSDTMAVKGYQVAASIYMQQGDLDGALRLLQQAQAESANEAMTDLMILEANAARDTWSPDKVLQHTLSLLELYPDFIPAILKHYTVSKAANKPETMSSHLEKRLMLNPENRGLTVLLARIKNNEGQFSQTVDLLESIKTDKAEAFWQTLATAYYETSNLQKLEQLYNEWIDLAPNEPNAILGKAMALQSRNKSKEALAVTSHYVDEIQGKRNDIKLFHCHLLLATNQWLAAEPLLLSLPESVQAIPFAQGVAGRILYLQKKYPQALDALNFAYNSVQSSEIASALYKTRYQLKGADSAYQFLLEHVKQNDTDAINVMRLAGIQATKAPEQSIATYLHALTLNDRNFIAHNNLAYLYESLNQLDNALLHAQKALELRPNNIDVLDTLGVIQLKLGQKQQALDSLSNAVTLMDKDIRDKIYINYIEALLVNQQVALAKRRIEQHQVSETEAATKLALLRTEYKL